MFVRSLKFVIVIDYVSIYICIMLRLECSLMAQETWVQSQVESYQRLKKWYLMPPCLTLSIIRYGSRVKWSNPGKGVAPSPTPWCSKLSEREPSGHPRLWSPTLLTYLYVCGYTTLWGENKLNLNKLYLASILTLCLIKAKQNCLSSYIQLITLCL